MKKNIGLIILIMFMAIIACFLAYVIVSKQNISQQEFNIKKGDVIMFENFDVKATILNVASTLCKNKATCIKEGEVEVSVQIDYADNISNYTLKSKTNSEERIKLSNYYLSLEYKDNELTLEVIEK